MKQLLIIALISALMAPTCYQDQSREGHGNSTTTSNGNTSHHGSRVPIDGGIALLAIGGLMFGLHKLKNKRNNQNPS